mmetsp:Transcript_14758/g.34766  ORF Transcript_14758/g.34766 Transcript_14758/m.34766 type:complete len:207 (+) Transcript_14758:134-754(+)
MAFGPPFSISFDGLTPHPHHTTTTFLTKLLVYFLVSFFFFVVFFSGDFSEPETRVPFPECALKSVDAACAMVPGTLGERLRAKGSVLEAKQNPARFKDRHFRRDALSGLERCAGEVVAEMCEVVELEEDLEAGQLRLCLELFPLFADLFNQIDAEDNQYAAMCMEHFTSFVRGPPNRRTVDRCGLLDVVLLFLSQVSEPKSRWMMP